MPGWLKPVSRILGLTFLGTGLFAVGVGLVALLTWAWETSERTRATTLAATQSGAATPTVSQEQVSLLGLSFPVTSEASLILLVVMAAALGSYVHAATSFGTFIGNRTFKFSWGWWYLLRLPIGIALALIFYFALRAGLVNAASTSGQISPFGVAALGGLTGLFSKQAVDKLQEVFDTVFRTQRGYGDTLRQDKLVRPRIRDIIPPEVVINVTATIRVLGEGFTTSSRVNVEGAYARTGFVSEEELTAEIPGTDLATPGRRQVTVSSPPILGASEPFILVVRAAQQPPAAVA